MLPYTTSSVDITYDLRTININNLTHQMVDSFYIQCNTSLVDMKMSAYVYCLCRRLRIGVGIVDMTNPQESNMQVVPTQDERPQKVNSKICMCSAFKHFSYKKSSSQNVNHTRIKSHCRFILLYEIGIKKRIHSLYII